jgi:ABC-type sulfate transport system substrate-binding protein
VVYEALAIEHFKNAVGRTGQQLRIVYPAYNLYSDHPLCLIDHPSITTAQRDVARRFQSYLLSDEIQRLALNYGYRPANLSIALFGGNTPFDDVDLKAAGLKADIGQELVIPSGDTITTLIEVWRRGFVN